MKGLSKNPLALLAVVLLLLGLAYFAVTKLAKPGVGSFSWKITEVTDKTSPSNHELDVYLSGDNVTDTQALELDASLDNSLLKLISATPGGFYQNPLTIKMDTDKLVFAIAKNPTNQSPVDPNQPVFKLYFTAKSGFTQTTFNILPSSQIYIRNSGGANPSASQIVVQK